MKLHLIWAQARGGVIGKDGTLPWHLSEDLAHFKAKTIGCPVIMGRKTWESLPPRFRPLPGRRNLVLTRSSHWQPSGAEIYASLDTALQACGQADTVWVIGGAQIYAQALPMGELAEVTEIDASFDGDAHAPLLGPQWVKSPGVKQVSSTGLTYSFNTYRHVRGDSGT
jgi:dihydrofolate reductase